MNAASSSLFSPPANAPSDEVADAPAHPAAVTEPSEGLPCAARPLEFERELAGADPYNHVGRFLATQ